MNNLDGHVGDVTLNGVAFSEIGLPATEIEAVSGSRDTLPGELFSASRGPVMRSMSSRKVASTCGLRCARALTTLRFAKIKARANAAISAQAGGGSFATLTRTKRPRRRAAQRGRGATAARRTCKIREVVSTALTVTLLSFLAGAVRGSPLLSLEELLVWAVTLLVTTALTVTLLVWAVEEIEDV